MDLPTDMDVPGDLIGAVKKQMLVPFVGAGLSMSVTGADFPGFPNWSALVERFERRLAAEALPGDAAAVCALRKAGNLTEAAELAFQRLTKPRFLEEIECALDPTRPADADLAAVEAVWRLSPNFIITTNFDRVLEWPFLGRGHVPCPAPLECERGEVRHVHNDDPSLLMRVSRRAEQPTVWHLHGSIRRPDTIVFTERQYQGLYGEKSVAWEQWQSATVHLQTLFATRPLLFVGFSLTDAFVRDILVNVLKRTARAGPTNYLVVRRGELDAAAFLRDYQVQPIVFDDFGAPFVRCMRELVAAAGRSPKPRFADGVRADAKELALELEGLFTPQVPLPARVADAHARALPRPSIALPRWGDGQVLVQVAVAGLADALPRDDGEHPLVTFARELVATPGAEVPAELDAWTSRARRALDRAPRSGGTDVALHAHEGRAPASKPGVGYLLVEVEKLRSEPDRFQARGWFFGPERTDPVLDWDRTYERVGLDELVTEVAIEAESRLRGVERGVELDVAFMLPRTLLLEDVDQWRPVEEEFPEPSLGASYSLTVRPSARPSRRRGLRAERLAAAWGRFKEHGCAALALCEPDAGEDGTAWWLDAFDTADAIARLRAGKVLCAVLAAPPTPDAFCAGRDLLNAVLQAGVPIVLWFRARAGLAPAEIRAEAELLLARGTPSDLPHAVAALRRAAEREPEDHRHRSISLIWDDADRLPPVAEATMAASDAP